MHILLGLLGILIAIGVWVWRLQMAKRGLDVAVDVAKTVANAPRRFAFKYKMGKGGLDLIDDPREAASIMLVLVALGRDGQLSDRQMQVIEHEIAEHFRVTARDAEELAAHASWVTRTCPPPEEAMRVLSRKIVNAPQLGPKEIVDLDAMLVAVSEAEELPTRAQLVLLQVYRDLAGLKT
ncbi:hypothetical protein [Hyphomonas sp.]|uniref:hypothetical protein n=1 Tax=Hyphomonas sp. TaxID=87 RepID=UPI00391D33C3